MKSNLKFAGYGKIISLPYSKRKINRYKSLLGEVAKIYVNGDSNTCLLDVKGRFNIKTISGYYYFSEDLKTLDRFIEPITKQQYEEAIPNLDCEYLVQVENKGYSFYAKSNYSLEVGDLVKLEGISDSTFKTIKIKKILIDQESELEEEYQTSFKKITGVYKLIYPELGD